MFCVTPKYDMKLRTLLLLGNILTMVSRADASAQRFWEVLDTQPAVTVIPNPHQGAAIHTDRVGKWHGEHEIKVT